MEGANIRELFDSLDVHHRGSIGAGLLFRHSICLLKQLLFWRRSDNSCITQRIIKLLLTIINLIHLQFNFNPWMSFPAFLFEPLACRGAGIDVGAIWCGRPWTTKVPGTFAVGSHGRRWHWCRHIRSVCFCGYRWVLTVFDTTLFPVALFWTSITIVIYIRLDYACSFCDLNHTHSYTSVITSTPTIITKWYIGSVSTRCERNTKYHTIVSYCRNTLYNLPIYC